MRDNELSTRVGPNTLVLRCRYGLSRKSLAMLIGMTVNRLRRIEAGDPKVKLYDYHLARISRIFGITMEELTDGALDS